MNQLTVILVFFSLLFTIIESTMQFLIPFLFLEDLFSIVDNDHAPL